jgi:signal transduction histidine kinase
VVTGTPADPVLGLRSDRLTLLWGAGSVVLLFAIGAAVQSATIYQLTNVGDYDARVNSESLAPRLAANLIAVATMIVCVAVAGLERRTRALATAGVLLIALAVAVVRASAQLTFGLYPLGRAFVIVDAIAGFCAVALSLALGMTFVRLNRRLRTKELENLHERLRASAALSALQGEELRVRREVAEGLHGTLQQRLVLIETRIASATSLLDATNDDRLSVTQRHALLEGLDDIERELEAMREVDVRGLSQLLYPAGADVGLVPAVRMMLQRVPASVQVGTTIDDEVRRFDAWAHGASVEAGHLLRRTLLIRVLEEGVSNALRHGHATRLAVSLDVDEAGRVCVAVDDDGTGIDPSAHISGLALLQQRARALGGDVRWGSSELGGARISGVLALRAPSEPDAA